mmetsp:Transcript_117652/g.344542  ORF Transcript_117652/g.344542 Transcript_117652/m.344542 type:complete len:201 (+) Transcript_117652:769-1371(+)
MVHGLSASPVNQECSPKSPFVVFTGKLGMVAPILSGFGPTGGVAVFVAGGDFIISSVSSRHSTVRMYCLPEGSFSMLKSLNLAWASAVVTGGPTMSFSPYFQSAGVARPLLAVSCREVRMRLTSSKLRPVVAGYRMVSFTVVPCRMTRARAGSGMPSAVTSAGSNMPSAFTILRSASAMIGNSRASPISSEFARMSFCHS